MSQSKITWRLSGKKVPWSDVKGSTGSEWKFEHRPGGWIVATRSGVEGKVERVRFSALDSGKNFGALLRGRLWHGELQSRRRGSAAAGGGDSDLTAQFPGKVRKLLVVEGESVRAGQGLILVEAMKMEFSIKAPSDGCVKRVLVEEGQQVSPGQLFVEFVSSPSGEQ